MKKVSYFSIFALAIQFTALNCFSQPNFTHYNREGYAQVMSIVQDSAGFLWISSSDLGRFDGYSIVRYTDSLGNRLNGALSVDPAGKVWLLSPERKILYGYNKKTDSFESLRPNIGAQTINSIGFENENKLWLGLYQSGLALYDLENSTVQKYFHTQADSLLQIMQNNIISIKNYSTYLLLGTSLGVWKFDKSHLSVFLNLRSCFKSPSEKYFLTPITIGFTSLPV